MKYISILGCTGSIGRNSLSVISNLSDHYKIHTLTCHKNISLLFEQINKYKPKLAVITDHDSYEQFINKYGKKYNNTKILFGVDGLEMAVSDEQVSIVIAAITGFSCVNPIILAIKNNKTILMANKEILVSAGDFIISILNQSQSTLIPIDSEHNALLQVILSSGLEYKINDKEYYRSKIKNLILTASGGPFIDIESKNLKTITPDDAVKHPTWSMGKKISIDSATMMNKGLEIIEAKVLFNLKLDNIKAVIHRQSKVHALVEFFDGTVIAHMSKPDMKIPISYALTYPQRIYEYRDDDYEYTDFSFQELSLDKFPCYRLSRNAAETGKNSGLILNAANEISVEYFLGRKILYTDIPKIIEDVLDTSEVIKHSDIESIIENDREIRNFTKNLIKNKYL